MGIECNAEKRGAGGKSPREENVLALIEQITKQEIEVTTLRLLRAFMPGTGTGRTGNFNQPRQLKLDRTEHSPPTTSESAAQQFVALGYKPAVPKL